MMLTMGRGCRRVHNHIMDMFNQQKAEGFFDPVVDATTAACRARLPWWQPEARARDNPPVLSLNSRVITV